MLTAGSHRDEPTWIFVDEYGNPNLNTKPDGVSTLFILVAVVVGDADLDAVRSQLSGVRRKISQSGRLEIKANRALRGGKVSAWRAFASSVSDVNFKFHALVVDKREVSRDSGLQYASSMVKHLHKRMQANLMAGQANVNIRADRYGDLAFRDGLGSYLQENHAPDLFSKASFDWADDADVLVQLADILCGLLARCYDPKKQQKGMREILCLLEPKLLTLEEWPVKYRFAKAPHELHEGENPKISGLAEQKAAQFIEQNQRALGLRPQVAVLKRLLFWRRFGPAGASTSAKSLLDHLHQAGLGGRDTNWLRREVIAPLRDADVLITSSPDGYRLPTSGADFERFAQHAESVCMPMLARVKRACDAAKVVTHGDVDVLGNEDFAGLSDLCNVSSGLR